MESIPPPFPSSAPPPIPVPKSSGSKWVLLGCGGCLGLIVLSVIGSFVMFFFAMNVITKTDVYVEAIDRAQHSAEVRQELGSPITNGWMFFGTVNYNNGAGTAAFTVPVSGPKGEATLKVNADKSAGAEWKYSTLDVEFPDGHKVDLRDPPSAQGPIQGPK